MDNKIDKNSALNEVNNTIVSIKSIRASINKNSKIIAILCVLVLIAIFSITIVYFFLNKIDFKSLSPVDKKTPVSFPTPIIVPATPIPLVQGPQTYSVSTSNTPQIYEAWFNTIDPKKETQTVRLRVRDNLGKVNLATASVKTDKLSKKYTLSLLNGTDNQTEWTGSWKLDDTYDKNFTITFFVTDDKGNKASIDLTIR